jgi:hypothetical protein
MIMPDAPCARAAVDMCSLNRLLQIDDVEGFGNDLYGEGQKQPL